MPTVTVRNIQNKTILAENGQENLLDILHSEIDWMFACGGKGRCTTCKGTILTGNGFLSNLSEHEKRCYERGKLKENERLMCQTKLTNGAVTVSVPKECQLPHIKYDEICF